jgi:hypothetical protein
MLCDTLGQVKFLDELPGAASPAPSVTTSAARLLDHAIRPHQ